jgi:CubicO group peptidase (beta-lactamase class C family)
LVALQRRLQTDVDAARLPGAVLRVAYRGREYCACVGWMDATRRMPMRPEAIFRIFSMTKPLTAVAAMQLVEEGQLSLSDRLVQRWGDAPWREEARAITVRDLLRHTAGYTYGARCADAQVRAAYARERLPLNPRGLSIAQFMRGIARVPLLHTPGVRWEYGLATDVLGGVLEAVSGQRLGALLRERIFAPLGMVDTAFDCRADSLDRLAQPFDRDPVDGTPLVDPDQTYDPCVPARMESGGAGALSTAADYLRFARSLLAISIGQPAQAHGPRGAPLLRPQTLALMTRDHLGTDGVANPSQPGISALNSTGYGFGLGFAVRLADTSCELPGAPGTFFWSGTAGTLFWVDPAHELAAVYMSQAPGASRQSYRRLVIQGVYEGLGL